MNSSHYCTRTGNGQGMRMLPVIHVYVPEVHPMWRQRVTSVLAPADIEAAIELVKSGKSSVSTQAKKLKTTAQRLIRVMMSKHGFDPTPYMKKYTKRGAK